MPYSSSGTKYRTELMHFLQVPMCIKNCLSSSSKLCKVHSGWFERSRRFVKTVGGRSSNIYIHNTGDEITDNDDDDDDDDDNANDDDGSVR